MKNPFIKIRVFFEEIFTELKKATWPTWKELRDSTIIVLVGIILMGIYVGIVDFSLFQVVNLLTTWVQRIFGG